MQNGGVLGSGKPMATPTLRRFRTMLSEREENGAVLSTDEIANLYEITLSELTLNSKPLITDFTIIADEQREHARGIADAICCRILEVPVEHKLPSLYLLDSIVKNIGSEYIEYFSPRLPEVFCHAYRKVHPNMHPAMRHLFGTWSTVFPSSVLRKIESHLQFTPTVNHQSGLPPLRASESPRPTHGIHVNPKFMEARRQFGHATTESNFQPQRGSSATSQIYGLKPSIGYDEFNSDDVEVGTSQLGAARLSSSIHAGPTSSGLDALKLHPSFGARIRRSPSPYGVGHVRLSSPPLGEFSVDNSPRKVAQRVSSSNSGLDYGANNQQLRQSAALRYTDGVDLERPRYLIDAYGIDKRKNKANHIHPIVDQLDVNVLNRSGTTKTWQNIEEEEYDWEDMSPTLADHGGHKDVVSSSLPPSRSLRPIPTLGTHDGAPLAPHLRSYWFNQAQLPVVNGSSMTEDVPSITSSHGVYNTMSGIRKETTPIYGYHYTPESWKLAQNTDHSSRYHHNATRGENNLEMPFRGGTILPSAGEHNPPSIASLHNAHARPSIPTFQANRPIRSQLDNWTTTNYAGNRNMNMSPFPGQFMDSTESQVQNSLPQFFNQQSGSIPLDQQSLAHQDMRQDVVPPRLLAPPLNYGYAPRGHVASLGNVLQSPVPIMQQFIPNLNPSITSMHLPGAPMLSFPRGPSPGTSQMLPVLQNATPNVRNPSAGGNYSNLFSSLMAQGLISLTNQSPAQDPVGLEFDPDLLKVRHETAITALYSDLPRQCTACGLRFKCQEAHSSHMDWHVTKNRILKNRKQKPSRKWFVSVNMWLTGAESLGTDAVPGFALSENVVETKDDEELAVPADDDQKVCALCGEFFDDFYSDETEEWMYKGAVYMNAPTGSTHGMDRSQLGPIVHAKCRPETGGILSQDFRNDEGYSEEGSQRKRMRI